MSIRLRIDRFVIVRRSTALVVVAASLIPMCLTASTALALPDDSTQPIQIQADRADRAQGALDNTSMHQESINNKTISA